MAEWVLTVGMEIHVELETQTKMFCGCKNDPFHSAPNTNVCPVCYGLPGALPLLNKAAIAMVTRFGQAINAELPEQTFWARKNYFYPDLPKGYQISQSTLPLVRGGKITIDGADFHLDHAHLEEDAGKLIHAAGAAISLVDYNRAGVPLLEIVTQPDFHTAAMAKRFCQELQRIMRELKISSADMEKGQMRCEANISVAHNGQELGTKVEIKNINSFRAVEKAIEYEYERQTKALEAGETIIAETRTWNDNKSQTVTMRRKETSADYRYFPEPDLPAVRLALAAAVAVILPEAKRAKLVELGFNKDIAQALVDKQGYQVVTEIAQAEPGLEIEAGKLLLAVPSFGRLPRSEQIEAVKLRRERGLTTTAIEEIIEEAATRGAIIREILPANDSIDIAQIAREVIAENQELVAQFKAGKEAAFNFLVGQAMKKSQGRANVANVRSQLTALLS